jgi:hypothetical protein
MPITQFLHISTMSVLIIALNYVKEHKIISYMIKQVYVYRQVMRCNAVQFTHTT